MEEGEIKEVGDGFFLLIDLLLTIGVVFLFGHSAILAHNPVVMMGLQWAFFGLCGGKLINEAVGLVDGEKIGVQIKE